MLQESEKGPTTQSFSEYNCTLIARKQWGKLYIGQSRSPSSAVNEILIKKFSTPPLDQLEGEAAFLREATALQSLDSPRILSPLGFGIENGTPYIFRHYLSGNSLREKLQHSTFSIATTLHFITTIGAGLTYAHERQRVHGHLCPENIIYNDRDEPLLTDFTLTSLQRYLYPLGYKPSAQKAGYMAPEQFSGAIDAKCDQYALGCIAYEMLAGKAPFAAIARSTSQLKRHSEPPLPLMSYVPELPEQINAAVLKALAKEPSERHSDIAAFLATLALEEPTTREIATPVAQEDPPPSAELPILPANSLPMSVPTTTGQRGDKPVLPQSARNRRFALKWTLALLGGGIILLGILIPVFSLLSRGTAQPDRGRVPSQSLVTMSATSVTMSATSQNRASSPTPSTSATPSVTSTKPPTLRITPVTGAQPGATRPAPTVVPPLAKFSFEDGTTSGWSGYGGVDSVQNSTNLARDGSHSLLVIISQQNNGPYISVKRGTATSFPQPGQTLTFYIYLPAQLAGATTKWLVKDSQGGWYYPNETTIPIESWTRVQYTIPSSLAGPVQEIGIVFYGIKTSGSLYIDAVAW